MTSNKESTLRSRERSKAMFLLPLRQRLSICRTSINALLRWQEGECSRSEGDLNSLVQEAVDIMSQLDKAADEARARWPADADEVTLDGDVGKLVYALTRSDYSSFN